MRLTSVDLAALRALYATWRAAEGTEDFFDEGMVDGGVYFGIREGGGLSAAAGTHVVSDGEGVAAVGGIYTHPGHRRRGLARRTTAAVVAALVERGVPTIGLNVAQANAPAIRLYLGLGFRIHAGFYEAHVYRET